jgi:hypothetical protein
MGDWSNGVLEYWVVRDSINEPKESAYSAFFQYSNTPVLQLTPVFVN